MIPPHAVRRARAMARVLESEGRPDYLTPWAIAACYREIARSGDPHAALAAALAVCSDEEITQLVENALQIVLDWC